MKKGDKIKVHMYDCGGREIITRNHGIIFNVYEKNGKLGIDWNVDRSPYTCRGDIFTPFYAFANNVIFENVDSGERFFYSDIRGGIVKAESEVSA